MISRAQARTCVFAIALTTIGSANAAQPLKMQDLETVTATVEAIDVDERMISLRGPGGRTVTFEVSSEVRNLPQVKVGDDLIVRYYESIAAEIKRKGSSTTIDTVDTAVDAATAPAGTKPAGVVGRTVTTTVVIQAVDKKNHSVMFSGPDSLVRSVTVERPEAQEFIATLKKGDQVEISYTEALAMSIEPAN
jgi:hypothetical protein